MHPCPCCENKTIQDPDTYDICDVCEWEDDPGQRKHPDDSIGANKLSLNEYRKQWNVHKAQAV